MRKRTAKAVFAAAILLLSGILLAYICIIDRIQVGDRTRFGRLHTPLSVAVTYITLTLLFVYSLITLIRMKHKEKRVRIKMSRTLHYFTAVIGAIVIFMAIFIITAVFIVPLWPRFLARQVGTGTFSTNNILGLVLGICGAIHSYRASIKRLNPHKEQVQFERDPSEDEEKVSG